MFLCEEHNIDAVIIGADVEVEAAREVALHHVTLRPSDNAKAVDVLWEPSVLFGEDARRGALIQ
jgi:hypothetical protein